MDRKISVVINTLNEEENIERAIKSVSWANEIIVCDMHSDDNSAVVAKRLGAKVFFHKRAGFVEPARNFAISQAEGDWILVLDADEEIPESLGDKLKDLIKNEGVVTYVEIPRKNIIFGEWMRASMWWPDYNVRFFKSGSVSWGAKIHSRPKTLGQGLKLPGEERFAMIHHNYTNLSQFILRMNRYSLIQAKELRADGYKLEWQDLVLKPMNEFLSRFFVYRGFDDGLHGLALSLLQAFSFLMVYLRIWEMEQFDKKEIEFDDFKEISKKAGEDFKHWLKYGNLSKNPVKRMIQKIKNKLPTD